MFTTSSPYGLPCESIDERNPGIALVGCSGWHHQHWRGRVDDEALPTTAWLREHARRFPTTEINNNDMNGYAVGDATRLTRMLDKMTGGTRAPGRAVATIRARRSNE